MNLLPQQIQTRSAHHSLRGNWGNIQHSTFNSQHSSSREHAPFDVECWELNAECSFALKSPRLSRAFTLIEIMMAMAIFGMVVTAIYATWTLIIKSAKIGQEAAAQVQRERVTFRTFKDAIASAHSFQADLQHYSFIVENGSTPTLSFVARLPEFFPRSGRFGDFDVRRVTFSLESGTDGQQQLVLRQTPILMETDETEQQYPFVLSRNVSKMEIELWDARKGKWVDEWTTTNEIPKQIKLALTYSRQNPDKPYSTQPPEVVYGEFKIYANMVPGGFQRRGQSTGTNAPGGQP